MNDSTSKARKGQASGATDLVSSRIPDAHAPGVVRADELYRLRELCHRLNWKEHAIRQARAAGLRMIVFGREKFVLGRDVLDFFCRLAEAQAGAQNQEGAVLKQVGQGQAENQAGAKTEAGEQGEQ
jgi:hypothetical protein